MADRTQRLASRLKRTWKAGLAIAVLTTAGAMVAYALNAFDMQQSERTSYDRRLRQFGVRGEASKIVIAEIDERTFAEVRANPTMARNFGNWPYRRNFWARIIEHLADQGARAVVIDAVMEEDYTDASADLALAEEIGRQRVPVYIGIQTHPSGRPLPRVKAVNARQLPPQKPAMASASDVSPTSFEFPDDNGPAHDEPATAAPQEVARALAFPVEAHGVTIKHVPPQQDFENHLHPAYPLSPIAPLLPVVSGFGLVDPEADRDGAMRRTSFVQTDGQNTYVTLSVAAAADLLGADRLELWPGRLRLGSRVVAINSTGDAEIDYGGAYLDRYERVSLFYVLDDWARHREGKPLNLRKGLFKDRVVLIGGTAVGTADVKATPFSSTVPGMAKHAAELEGLLEGQFIVEAPRWVSVLVTLLFALLTVAAILGSSTVLIEVATPVLLAGASFVTTGLLLGHAKVHVLDSAPILAIVASSVAAIALNHLFANRERDFIRQRLGRYVSPEVARELENENVTLDGEDLLITAFFSDIRGFSSFSERYKDDPRGLVNILNLYLSRVTARLQDHGGCIDKYIGDAVVCLFGAPMKHEDHAIRACRAALATRDAVELMREEFRAKGWPDVYTRIGLNSAVMLVGTIGNEQLRSYTAIGDGMNLASRLEGANKSYGTSIMIGPLTYELAREAIEVRELDRVRVAGKNEPVTVYELLALRGEVSEAKRETVRRYEEALGVYRRGEFGAAIALLEAGLARDPEDGPTRALLERCRKFLLHPPAAPFDGVVSLGK